MKEMIKEFYKHIDKMNGKEYLENYLKYHLAPLIENVKPSLTIKIGKQKNLINIWNEYGSKILEQYKMQYVVLREYENAKILLIYKSSMIERILMDAQIQEFLIQIGYQKFQGEKAIEYLVKRYKQYHCPHELGIFLGIPLEDVKDFMDCGGKQCLLCGYWKVYNDVEKALKIFRSYDEAKQVTLERLLGCGEGVA